MSIPDFVQFVQGVGFPVAVAAFLLWDRVTVMSRFVRIMERIDAKLSDKGSDVLRRV